ncbi:MAG TPA: LysM peptidoglycan-binding domain-containing protein, partial [Albitalea sp.]
VLLPYDNANLFVRALAEHSGATATWTAWVAPRTLRPADAARQVGMSETELRDVNRIPPRMLVKAGSTLLVPRAPHRHADVDEHIADNGTIALAPEAPPLRRVSLKAGRKDTVASIARRYRVPSHQVALWNKMSTSASFKPGQTIVVYVAGKSARGMGVHKSAGVKATRGSASVKSVRKSASPKAARAPGPRAQVRAAKVAKTR